MGIGFGKIITGAMILAVPIVILLIPLTTFLSFIPGGTIPPEAMGLVTSFLTGKTIVDLPEICDSAMAMAGAYGGAPPELASVCGLADKYIPLGLYALYGMMAIGALMILWGLSPLFMGKKETPVYSETEG